MRYNQIVESGYSWQLVQVPLVNLPHGVQKGTPEQAEQAKADGLTVAPTCGIRCLSPGEELEVDQRAAAFCASEAVGVTKYDDVNPACVNARMIYTVAMACVDPDSDRRKPVLFFGDSIEEAAESLRKDPKRCLTIDTIVYLHERYLLWKDKINPQANTVSDYELQEMCKKAADDADFLALLRPGLRLKFTHTLAVLCVSSPELSLLLSSLQSRDSTAKPGPKKAAPRKTAPVQRRTKKTTRRRK